MLETPHDHRLDRIERRRCGGESLEASVAVRDFLQALGECGQAHPLGKTECLLLSEVGLGVQAGTLGERAGQLCFHLTYPDFGIERGPGLPDQPKLPAEGSEEPIRSVIGAGGVTKESAQLRKRCPGFSGCDALDEAEHVVFSARRRDVVDIGLGDRGSVAHVEAKFLDFVHRPAKGTAANLLEHVGGTRGKRLSERVGFGTDPGRELGGRDGGLDHGPPVSDHRLGPGLSGIAETTLAVLVEGGFFVRDEKQASRAWHGRELLGAGIFGIARSEQVPHHDDPCGSEERRGPGRSDPVRKTARVGGLGFEVEVLRGDPDGREKIGEGPSAEQLLGSVDEGDRGRSRVGFAAQEALRSARRNSSTSRLSAATSSSLGSMGP